VTNGDQSQQCSIAQHEDFHATQQNSPFAAEFADLLRKMQNCPFFATFISNSSFLGLLFNFTVYYKTIKSSRCKLWFCAVALRQSLTQDNLRAYYAVFLIIVIFFDFVMIFSSVVA